MRSRAGARLSRNDDYDDGDGSICGACHEYSGRRVGSCGQVHDLCLPTHFPVGPIPTPAEFILNLTADCDPLPVTPSPTLHSHHTLYAALFSTLLHSILLHFCFVRHHSLLFQRNHIVPSLLFFMNFD